MPRSALIEVTGIGATGWHPHQSIHPPSARATAPSRYTAALPGVGGCKIPIAPDDFLYGIEDYFHA